MSSLAIVALPIELEREIFETTALTHQECAVRLMLVSRRVRLWVEGVIFTTVSLLTMNDVSSFLRAIDLRPANFFANHIKTLSVTDEYGGDAQFRILSACTGVTNLTCSNISYQSFQALSSLHSLCRISAMFHQSPFHLYSFRNVTHVVVMDPTSVWTEPDFIDHENLPRLTHLILRLSPRLTVISPNYWPNSHKDVVPNFLRRQLSRPPMRVCVLFAEDGDDVRETKEFLEDIDDPRLVVMSAKRVSFGMYDHHLGMDRIDDIWAVAEQIALVQHRVRAGDNVPGDIPDESIFDVDWTGYYQSLIDEFDVTLETASDMGKSEDDEA